MSMHPQYGFNGFFPGTTPWNGAFNTWNSSFGQGFGQGFGTGFGTGFGSTPFGSFHTPNTGWNNTGWNNFGWNQSNGTPTGGWNGFGGWNSTPFGFNQTVPFGGTFPSFGTTFGASTPFSGFGNGWTGTPGWNSAAPAWFNQTTPFGWNGSGWNGSGWNGSTPFGWNAAPFGAVPFGWWNQSVPQTGTPIETGVTGPTNTPAYPFPFGGFNPFFCCTPQVTSNGTPATKAA
jgi:hypothetical protein